MAGLLPVQSRIDWTAMNVFFCTGCDAGLVIGQRRCPRCSARPGLSLPRSTARPVRSGWLAAISAFFASQASLSLTTLLVFLASAFP